MSGDPTAVSGMPTTTADVERELRGQLAGARLIFELGIDERRHRQLKVLVAGLARSGAKPDELARRYPALYATHLTLTGVFGYAGGDYWSGIHSALRDPNLRPGYAFWEALRRLRLETFDLMVEQEVAQRWVTRILAHGGIPVSCLDPFVELLTKETSRGVPDATELLSSWRARRARLAVLHEPTRRFLLYGGQPAVDLLDRCIDVLRERARTGAVPTANEAGLPQYVLDAFGRTSLGALRRGNLRARTGIPQPAIMLDPYAGLGPVAMLPAVNDDQQQGFWRVADDGDVHRSDASLTRQQVVRVPPSRAYEIEFLGSDVGHRRWTYEGLDRFGLMVFEPTTGRLVREPALLAMDEAWLLLPADADVAVQDRTDGDLRPARQVQELPRPSASWSGYDLQHLDLEGIRRLQVTRDGATVGIAVTAPRERPRLDGPLASGVEDVDGYPVFSGRPVVWVPELGLGGPIEWTVRVRSALADGARAIVPVDQTIDLEDLIASDGWGAFHITVRGPLGSDLSTRVTIVPGLDVQRPMHIVHPGRGVAEARVRVPGARVDGHSPGETVKLAFADDATAARCSVLRDGHEALALRVGVDRLLWTIVHDTKPAVRAAASLVRVGAEEFEDYLADLLLVQTGRDGVPLQLELLDGDTVQQRSDIVLSSGAEGRWSFDLGRFADYIRASGAGRLGFRLLVDGWPVHVADVVAPIEIRAVSAHRDATGAVTARFEQERVVHSRIARLWSDDRPWEAPAEVDVEDGAGEVEFGGPVWPGRYRFEVAVADAWTAPARPSPESPAARSLQLGSREDVASYLASLDPREPHTTLTRSLAGVAPAADGDPPALEAIAGDIARACLHVLRDVPAGVRSNAALQRVLTLLCSSDHLLCAGLLSVAESEAASTGELTRLGLRVLFDRTSSADPVDAETMSGLWRSSAIVAGWLDIPWARLDEEADERCEALLGWSHDGQLSATEGARLSQQEVALPADLLEDIRRTIGLLPLTRLDPAELQTAMFEWLGEQKAAESRPASDSVLIPRNWYYSYRSLLRAPFAGVDEARVAALRRHLGARMPTGTFEWAALPCVTLCAAAHLVWANGRSHVALEALEHALAFGERLVVHDVLLALVLGQEAQRRESDDGHDA